MAETEMRPDRGRIVRILMAVAVVAIVAILVPMTGNASYAIGYWLGSH